MSAIWKYPLDIVGEQIIKVPIGARLLTAQTQSNKVCIWAEIPNSEAPVEKRTIIIVGTGHQYDQKNLLYVGTAQTSGGSLVWHIFEKRDY